MRFIFNSLRFEFNEIKFSQLKSITFSTLNLDVTKDTSKSICQSEGSGLTYLHVTEVCWKVMSAMFYFCHSKSPSSIIKNVFNSISTYFSQKYICLNKHKKQMCYKKNKSLFLWSCKICPSKVSHFHYDHGLLFSREMGNIGSCKVVCIITLG